MLGLVDQTNAGSVWPDPLDGIGEILGRKIGSEIVDPMPMTCSNKSRKQTSQFVTLATESSECELRLSRDRLIGIHDRKRETFHYCRQRVFLADSQGTAFPALADGDHQRG